LLKLATMFCALPTTLGALVSRPVNSGSAIARGLQVAPAAPTDPTTVARAVAPELPVEDQHPEQHPAERRRGHRPDDQAADRVGDVPSDPGLQALQGGRVLEELPRVGHAQLVDGDGDPDGPVVGVHLERAERPDPDERVAVPRQVRRHVRVDRPDRGRRTTSREEPEPRPDEPDRDHGQGAADPVGQLQPLPGPVRAQAQEGRRAPDVLEHGRDHSSRAGLRLPVPSGRADRS
jgi:hypothetical protein